MPYPTQQNATDQTANFFWLLCIIVAAFLIAWWLGRKFIIAPVFWFRIVEIDMINYAILAWSKIANPLHLPVPRTHVLNYVRDLMMRPDSSQVTFNIFAQINSYIGKWMRYPAAIILMTLAVIVHFRHGSLRFRNAHNMQSLKKLEVENWPQITPVLTIDLVKEDLEKGPWAISKLPLDYCKENNLAQMVEVDGKSTWSILRGPAQRAFALQLGALWRGPQVLPIHMKALFIIFVARAERHNEVANKLLSQIAASAMGGQLDFSGVEELMIKYQNSQVLHWLVKRHAYVYTFMASLLEIARADGVLATAEFLWLKPLDRKLWYVLNNVGRQTAFVECAGVYAHWLSEKKIGQGLKTPMVKEAVNALEQCIQETLYISEGERWRTSNVA